MHCLSPYRHDLLLSEKQYVTPKRQWTIIIIIIITTRTAITITTTTRTTVLLLLQLCVHPVAIAFTVLHTTQEK
jgi:hypothetical protein